MMYRIEVYRCADCGRVAVAVDDVRITSHKCSGRWLLIASEEWSPDPVPPEDGPYVCPGCYAVGDEPCAPGCIDAEMAAEVRERLESGDYDRADADDDDE
jgi:hypothetical protein